MAPTWAPDPEHAPRAGAHARHPGLVWYLSYGSNTHPDRLASYLAGGRPPGAARTYPGCRDPRPPAASVALEVPGALYFATESPVWTGGRAFYDAEARGGRVLARAHLITAGQFSDVAAQEMYREPGPDGDLDLRAAVRDGRAVLGEGRYETLVCPGTLDGHPLLTFTAPWAMDAVAWNRPSAPYVRYLVRGLLDAGAWDAGTIAAYLAACPGAAGHWTATQIMELMAQVASGA
ncbi:histone deacetylase [Streptomyces coeruleoprunus]|uniref:Histone deacetylase n=1 Tax=Streptomyces coeruleoprunus TaxID=285563 RepID=A0ABV9XKS5_9ACTN